MILVEGSGLKNLDCVALASYTPATKSTVSARVDFVADLSPVSATFDFVASVYRALNSQYRIVSYFELHVF